MRIGFPNLKVWATTLPGLKAGAIHVTWCAIVLALAGCRSERAPQAPPTPPRHLLIVTIDTLRADRLGCYGNRDVKTPNLDRLAAEGTLVEQAEAHAPQTRPSHLSLFTGRYPYEHGIRDNVSPSFVAEEIPTLAEIVQRSGFRTAAFVSAIVVGKQSGLNRGFDIYDDRLARDGSEELFLNTLQRRGDRTTDQVDAWMRSTPIGPSDRLAVWVHLYDPHDPYEPPEPYATQYAGRPYDGEVAWSDELMGRLIKTFDQAGILDDTLVVVTSDHGEGLGEHQEPAHGFFIYQTTLHVPLMVRGRGVSAGRRLPGVARLVDLFPTVLDLLQVARPAGLTLSGQTIAPALRGRGSLPNAPSLGETLVPLLHFGWSDLRSIRAGRWKYILAPRPELYDLERDPKELTNLVESESSRARDLRGGLEATLRLERQTEKTDATTASVPPELLEKLGALGYVSGGSTASGSPSAGADPKDKIEEFKLFSRLMREGLMKLHEKDYKASAERLTTLHRRGMDSFEVNFYLGRAIAGMGLRHEAIKYFETAIARAPAYGAAYLELANAKAAIGDRKGAVDVLQKGVVAAPKDPTLYEREAELWRQLKNPGAAIRAYETMARLVPKDALVRIRLGELYRDTGNVDRAVSYLREGVKLDPGKASYWNSLGMILGGNNDLIGAESAFREATKLNDREPQYAYNLGLVMQRQGRSEEATGYFRRALELNPGFRAARERMVELGAQ